MAKETTIVRTLEVELPTADAINHPTVIVLKETFMGVIIDIDSGGDSELVCVTIPHEERQAIINFLIEVKPESRKPEEEKV